MNKIEEAMTGYWGERCPDHEPDCPTCQAWGELDKLSDECAEAHRLLKTCRAVLNMAGYYDLVQTIDNLMGEQA